MNPNMSSSQIWLLLLLSIVVTVIVTTLLVRAENNLLGDQVKDLGSRVTMWVLKALTQESELLIGAMRSFICEALQFVAILICNGYRYSIFPV